MDGVGGLLGGLAFLQSPMPSSPCTPSAPPPPAMISDLGWGQRMDTASVGLPGVGEVGAEEEGQVKEGGKGKEEWRCWVERW